MRGYSDQEVDNFLEDVRNDYEKLHRENTDLKTKNGIFHKTVGKL